MCELCSDDPDVRQKTINKLFADADRLDRLAVIYRDLASGVIKPHTKEYSDKKYTAYSVIRNLVDDWI